MGANATWNDGGVAMSISEQIETTKGIIEDAEYNLKKVRSPAQKRRALHTLNFLKSILESLMELNNLKSQ